MVLTHQARTRSTQMIAALAALAWSTAALAVAPPEPAPLAPSGKWVISYEESMCVLSRRYGSGSEQVDLGFRPIPTQAEMQLVLVTPAGRSRNHGGTATLMLDDVPAGQVSFASVTIDHPPRRVTTAIVAADLIGRMATASALTVKADAALVLAIPGAAGAARALSACQDDLLRSWGLDPKALHGEVSHARLIGNIADWFGPDQYPDRAARENAQGRTVAGIIVDASGMASGCKIIESSGTAELDTTTCAIAMRRARFAPARDAGGRAIASWYILPVRWSQSFLHH